MWIFVATVAIMLAWLVGACFLIEEPKDGQD